MDENQMAQFREILGALLVRTRKGRVKWEQSSFGTFFSATLASGKVIVNKDDDYDTVVRIMDTDSNILGEINSGYRKHVDLKENADELYELARRSALQVDSKLESILREISA